MWKYHFDIDKRDWGVGLRFFVGCYSLGWYFQLGPMHLMITRPIQ